MSNFLSDLRNKPEKNKKKILFVSTFFIIIFIIIFWLFLNSLAIKFNLEKKPKTENNNFINTIKDIEKSLGGIVDFVGGGVQVNTD